MNTKNKNAGVQATPVTQDKTETKKQSSGDKAFDAAIDRLLKPMVLSPKK